MYAGLDFGTSKCSIGLWQNSEPYLVPLEGHTSRIPSVAFTPLKEIKVESIDENELNKRVAIAKREQTREQRRLETELAKIPNSKLLGLPIDSRIRTLTEEELRNRERGVLRREVLMKARQKEAEQRLTDLLSSRDKVLFGNQALEAYIADPDPEKGRFFKSPKSFLGEEMIQVHIDTFTKVTAWMMEYLKTQAESRAAVEINQVVIGRPVNFSETRGEIGNQQALGILQQAASIAGFDDVAFLYEPVAAALDYERTLLEDQILLVVDLGGGTTDCTVMRAGPSRRNSTDRSKDILSNVGYRVGGTDLDFNLNFYCFMPVFGKNQCLVDGRSVPYGFFWDAIAVNNLPAQDRFFSPSTGKEIEILLRRTSYPELFRRFQILRDRRLNHRLNQSAEVAKIMLSELDSCQADLGFIEPNLQVSVTQSEFALAIERELKKIRGLIDEAIQQAGVKPDAIYVTGGSAYSPILRNMIESVADDRPIIFGDAFGSVVSGLTVWANRCFS